MAMAFNLVGKINYVSYIIKNYPEWFLIFVNKLLKKGITKLRLRNGLIILGGKRSLILDIADEIFLQKVYNPKFMSIHRGDTVIDIGANIGIFCLYSALKGAKNIYACEPLPENIPLINPNFQVNKFIHPVIIETAVTNKKGERRLYLGDTDSHGLLFNHDYKKKFTKFIKVPTTTLRQIILTHKIKKVDFLKVDCEGCEGLIIVSTPISILKKIDKIAIEYHNGVSRYSHDDIVDKLKKGGFQTKLKVVDRFLGYIYAWRKR